MILKKKFFHEQHGGVIEWVIIAAVAGLIASSLFPGFRQEIITWYGSMTCQVDSGITRENHNCDTEGEYNNETFNTSETNSMNTYSSSNLNTNSNTGTSETFNSSFDSDEYFVAENESFDNNETNTYTTNNSNSYSTSTEGTFGTSTGNTQNVNSDETYNTSEANSYNISTTPIYEPNESYSFTTFATWTPKDCLDIIETYTHSESGFYTVSPEGYPENVTVYCDMETDGGGWTLISNHIFDEDRSIPNDSELVAKDAFDSHRYSGTAPEGWYTHYEGSASGNKQYNNFFINEEGFEYEEIVFDVQFSFVWTVDSLNNTHGSPPNRMSLEGQYVDGVSITNGEPNQRNHLWSLTRYGTTPDDERGTFILGDLATGSRIERTLESHLPERTNERIETRIMLDQIWWDESIGMQKFVTWIR